MTYVNTDLKVEILTPTHIGMGQEKNYQRGLDFIIKNNINDDGRSLYILHPEKIIEYISRNPKDLQDLTLKLSKGNYREIESYLNRTNILLARNVVRVELAYDDSITEIKRQFSNGLGSYLVPGSSLKGAIRSVLYKTLKQGNPNSRRDDELFGKIGNNLMNLLTVGDITFSSTSVKIYRTKIFSADGRPKNGYGSWKHEKRGCHRDDFTSNEFVSYYEAIKPKTESSVRLGLSINMNSAKLASIPNARLLFQKGPSDLIQLIKNHSRTYLERELHYYQQYPNDDLENIAQKKLESLLSHNEATSSCVLRVGANVGFHSITGDWQLNSHTNGWHFNQQSRSEQIKAKTRKFAFTKKAAGGFDFHPMGFIKLTLP
ncbi:hypothetical protein GCM10027275_54410 [Rhabdobacter roseus]|uniref:CRISPR system Cms protein Csm5 n=1 Tax=Rhabdobacter roseus TaxID=1655419 RepID=A0A840TWZ7_9BACT|nr:RAMP superfamily CRISPR-associated protein [Rhabdobacter roseus]MBB5287455.1 CRISPR/Cas system CSM-associated protein Csm5 (group 7 of RAMP superfamily) [Rhabdobacter roseus]